MPTNRKRKSRTRTGDNSIQSWIRWNTSILKYVSPLGRPDCPWTAELSQFFWEENKTEIMAIYLDGKKQLNQPFQRPEEYFAELEAKHPRHKVGTEKYFSPQNKDGVIEELSEPIYESNEKFLKRLNLLQDWEITKK